MEQDRRDSLSRLADLLEVALANSSHWSGISSENLAADLHRDAQDVLANVDHFLSDADIRKKDAAYKSMQERQMMELIAALRRGAARQELLRFTFLK